MSNSSERSETSIGVSWGEFRVQQPDLAVAGRELLYQVGVGLAFLSTVRADGGPRLHPICVVLTDDGMYAFLIPSPKAVDLRRDNRFALHSYPTESNEDAFYVTGRARVVEDGLLRRDLERQFLDERAEFDFAADSLTDQTLVEFMIERCLVTRTSGHGDEHPRHVVWRAT